MFKFENNSESKSRKDEEASPLQKIRDHSEITPIIKTIVLATVLGGGLELGAKNINEKTTNKQKLEMGNEDNHKIDIKQKIEKEKIVAEKYLIKRSENQKSSLSEMLNDNCFLDGIANERSMENYGNLESLHEERRKLENVLNKSKSIKTEETSVSQKDINTDSTTDNSSNPVTFDSDQADSVGFIKKIAAIDSLINREEQKKQIAREKAREMIIDLSILVEKAKIEVIEHLQSEEYLGKLAGEMNITLEAAKEHQRVRINNVVGLSYYFQNSANIEFDSGGGYAYYDADKKTITLPYNVNLEIKSKKEYFYEALLHEIFHLTTQSDKGMSDKSKNILEKSFIKNKDYINVEYYSQPLELIVRKQILDLEMEKMGVKKYGEKFTNEHYKKLLILKDENKLSQDARAFIDHINPEYFSKIMNELAEVRDNEQTYHHVGWDYNNKENQA